MKRRNHGHQKRHHALLDILIGYGGLNFFRCSCGVRDMVGQDDPYEARLAWEMHRDEVLA